MHMHRTVDGQEKDRDTDDTKIAPKEKTKVTPL